MYQTTAVQTQAPATQVSQTKCIDCLYRNVDMAERCDLHTQRREVSRERILIVSCTGYKRDKTAQ